jgi:predicted nucleic acid-binding protein
VGLIAARFALAPQGRIVASALRGVARADLPDLPDRVIAASAAALRLPLVTKDGGFGRRTWKPSGER